MVLGAWPARRRGRRSGRLLSLQPRRSNISPRLYLLAQSTLDKVIGTQTDTTSSSDVSQEHENDLRNLCISR